jgi:integrase
MTLDDALEQFRTKMVADGSTSEHVKKTVGHVLKICHEADIATLQQIRREVIERWIATEFQKKERSPRTINSYLISIRAFVGYLNGIEVLPINPLKPIKKLNEAVDRRKNRRALTADEVERLLAVADRQRGLVYRLFLGTGLNLPRRSTSCFDT